MRQDYGQIIVGNSALVPSSTRSTIDPPQQTTAPAATAFRSLPALRSPADERPGWSPPSTEAPSPIARRTAETFLRRTGKLYSLHLRLHPVQPPQPQRKFTNRRDSRFAFMRFFSLSHRPFSKPKTSLSPFSLPPQASFSLERIANSARIPPGPPHPWISTLRVSSFLISSETTVRAVAPVLFFAVRSFTHEHDHEHGLQSLPPKRAPKPTSDHVAFVVRRHAQRRLGFKVDTKILKYKTCAHEPELFIVLVVLDQTHCR